MTETIVILLMGLVAWYAWPAAPDFGIKAATVFFAVFLAPFSWPWLIARGRRHRRLHRLDFVGRAAVEGFTAGMRQAEIERLRQENIAWWRNEWKTAESEGDAARRRLALDVLAAMGATNLPGRRTS